MVTRYRNFDGLGYVEDVHFSSKTRANEYAEKMRNKKNMLGQPAHLVRVTKEKDRYTVWIR